ncbi:alpha/beta hydrolase [Buchananella hordeovulneris]|uniref:alpha/beta hydrolase n=1 Tax=Buchananella hordeovulneris TaxID=52770 RepID=UPI000F5F13DF|nr:alpha/beta hydrolase [Buchananella hordeovulneris]RRD52654.1 alpha/beta hydrolase [Buchananella hordeovulneris]
MLTQESSYGAERARPGPPLRARDIRPAFRWAYRWVPQPPVANPRWLAAVQAASRRITPPRLTRGLDYRYVPLADGVGAHVYTPRGARQRPGLLWIHGGGYLFGNGAHEHRRCARQAHELGAVVVSPEYRFAPADPYPAALSDVAAAWRWLVDHCAELGVDAGRLVVGGQSAGGGLAAALTHQLHDAGGRQPAARWLFCPMLDDRTAADRSLDERGHFLWNNHSNWFAWRAYTGLPPGSPQVPEYAAPGRRADLRGLPPTWLGVGDIDLFYGETRRYARRLAAAGVDTELVVVPGGPHAFESYHNRTRPGRAFLDRANDWLLAQLAAR